MQININAFGDKLIKCAQESHKGQTKEQITARINDIFEEYGATDTNFPLVSLAISAEGLSNKSDKTSYIYDMSKFIYEKDKKKEEKENVKPKPKFILKYTISFKEIDGKSTEQIKEIILNKIDLGLNELGYTPEQAEEFKQKLLSPGKLDKEKFKGFPQEFVDSLNFEDKASSLDVEAKLLHSEQENAKDNKPAVNKPSETQEKEINPKERVAGSQKDYTLNGQDILKTYGKELAKKIYDYSNLDHSNDSRDKLISDLKQIFAEFGAKDKEIPHVDVVIDGKNIEFDSSTTTYIERIADRIYKKEERNRSRQEISERSVEEQEKEHINHPAKRKMPVLSFDIVSLGESEPEAIEEFFRQKFTKAGYTQEDFNKPMQTLNVLDFRDKSMDLNITPDAPILEQFVEIVKKMYRLLVNHEPIESVRYNDNMNVSEAQTSINLDLPGTEFDVKKDIDGDSPQNIDVNMSNGMVDIDNSPDNDLTPEDLEEINNYGIEGIGTHAEMENFRSSEEYQLIQQAQINYLSKNNNSPY